MTLKKFEAKVDTEAMATQNSEEDELEGLHLKEEKRFGFKEFEKEQLMQYKYFLKGFFFQSSGLQDEAIYFYKKSLLEGGDKSWHWCR